MMASRFGFRGSRPLPSLKPVELSLDRPFSFQRWRERRKNCVERRVAAWLTTLTSPHRLRLPSDALSLVSLP
jgi:hypothetical protein